MLDRWNRAKHYLDLAEECGRLAKNTFSSQLKHRYLLMAKDYILLADIEEQAQTYCTRLQDIPKIPEPLQ